MFVSLFLVLTSAFAQGASVPCNVATSAYLSPGFALPPQGGNGCVPETLFVRMALAEVLPDGLPEAGQPLNVDLSYLRSVFAAVGTEANQPHRVVVRLTVSDGNAGDAGRHPAPWMQAAGWVKEEGGYWGPDWSNKDFRATHERVLSEIGSVVSANVNKVGWVEIGSYGIWGEWHIEPGKVHLSTLEAPETLRVGILDAYDRIFSGIPLVIPYDSVHSSPDVTKRLIAMHVGIRNDALGHQEKQFDSWVASAIESSGLEPHKAFPGVWAGEFYGDKGARETLFWKPTPTVKWVGKNGLSFVGPGGFGPLTAKAPTAGAKALKALLPESALASAIAAAKKARAPAVVVPQP